jgi:hypothetical protein
MPTPHEQVVAGSPTTPPEPGVRRSRRLTRQGVAWLVVLGVVLLTALVVLTRPGGTMQGTATQSVSTTGISGPLVAGTTITQEITATGDDLVGFSATFGTYGGAEDCAIEVTVEDDRGATLVDGEIPCADLADTAPTTIASFDPVPDSADRTFTVTYTGAPGEWSEGVTLWVGEPTEPAVPAEATGDETAVLEVFEDDDTATATIAEYQAPSVWHQLWRGAGLAAVGAPWWGQPVAQAIWAAAFVGAAVAAVALRRRRRLATALLVVLALARGLMWATLIPPLQGMDEGAHVTYVEYMAEQGTIPVRGEPLEGAQFMYSEQLALLDGFQNRDAMLPADRADHDQDAVDRLNEELAETSAVTNGQAPGTGYPPVYYAPAAAIYELTPGTLLDKIYAMRLWSVVLGGLAAWATMAAARRLLPRSDLMGVLLALGVTVQPMMAHQFAIVNNDALAITAGIATIAIALRAAAGRPGWRLALAAGACVGLALLSKPYGIGALPVAALGLLIGVWKGSHRVRGVLLAAAGGLAGLAATYGVWTAYQLVAGVPSTTLPSYPGGDTSRGGWHYVDLQLANGMHAIRTRWAEQLFGTFAWLDVRLPETAYDLVWGGLWVTVALVVAWLVVTLVRLVRRRPVLDPPLLDGRDDPGVTVRTMLALVAVLGVLFTLYAAGYLYFRNAGADELLQGRYALMMLPALLALPTLVTESFTTSSARLRRAAPLAVTALITLSMWALYVLSFATIADRFYL